MKKIFFVKIILFTFLSLSNTDSFSQLNYNDWFTENCLRIDYYHTGDHNSEQIYLKELKKEKYWAGTRTNMLDPFAYGAYYVKVFNKTDNKLIFSYGFNSLFEEWQFTDEAKVLKKGFEESIILPFPKRPVVVELYSRRYEDNNFIKIHAFEVDPDDMLISSETVHKAETRRIYGNAEYSNALDMAFIADGYSSEEIEDFFNDVKIFSDYVFSVSPFKENRDKINIWAIGAISSESGTDIPRKNIWKSTSLNSNFDTFGSERYLTSSDFHRIRDYASLVPCDQVCILVNTEIYGGGGIFNFWNITSAKNPLAKEVFVHELGHSLGYLADEYYDSDSGTENLHNKNTEPVAPNLTTLVDFDSKWKDMMLPETPVPTPITESNKNIVGVYEGGGYQTKGIYRPYIDCKMRVLNSEFCPVCKRSITDIIDYYVK